MLWFSSHLIVVVVVVPAAGAAAAFDAAVFAVDVVEIDAEIDAAASEDESGAVETVVQLKECAWHDCYYYYYLDRTVAPLQKKQSSS